MTIATSMSIPASKKDVDFLWISSKKKLYDDLVTASSFRVLVFEDMAMPDIDKFLSRRHGDSMRQIKRIMIRRNISGI